MATNGANFGDKGTFDAKAILVGERIALRQVGRDIFADNGIEQREFIGEVRVERRTINGRTFGNVLHAGRFDALLRQQRSKRIATQLLRTRDPRIDANFARLGVHNHQFSVPV